MEHTTPYIRLPPAAQVHETSADDNLQGNNSKQVPMLTSQSHFNYVPPLQNVTKGDSAIHDFRVSSCEVIQGGALNTSPQMMESCGVVLDSFSQNEALEDDSALPRHSDAHANNQNLPVLPPALRQFELSSGLDRFEESDFASFSGRTESSAPALSHQTNNVPPSPPLFVCDHCNEQFTQLQDLTTHVRSSHPLNENFAPSKLQSGCGHQCSVEKESQECEVNLSEKSFTTENQENSKSFDEISSEDLMAGNSVSDQMTEFLNTGNESQDSSSFVCTFCPKTCRSQEMLIKHEALHVYQTSAILCSKCGEILGNYMLLQEHKQYEDYLSSCDICGQLFPNEECMISHIRNAHNDIDDNFEEDSLSSQGIQEETSPCEAALLTPNIQEGINNSDDISQPSVCEESNEIAPGSPPSESFMSEEVNVCGETGKEDTEENGGSNNEDNSPLTKTLEDDESTNNLYSNSTTAAITAPDTEELSVDLTDFNFVPDTNKNQKMKCRYCSKKCSTRKSLVRHERCHPYETAAMKCYLCLEVVENYKALKAHKKKLGSSVTCSTCDQICPNETCLACHTRNVHNNTVYKVKPTFSSSNESNEDVPDFEENGSDSDGQVIHQYSVSRYTVSDPGAPLRITIKQEKGEVPELPASPTFSASTPPTPPTPSNQGPPTPSPPMFVFESEHSDAEDEDEFEPYASDQSSGFQSGRSTRRKSSLRASKKSSVNPIFLSSSEESDHDESGDFNFEPQSYSESEEDSEDDSKWTKAEDSIGNTKRRTRKSNPISDDSDDDPDWRRAKNTSTISKRRGRRRKGPLSDDSENDQDWGPNKKSTRVTRNRTLQKRSAHSDSDNDPEWQQFETVPEEPKKKPVRKRGRKRKLQVAFFLPAISVPKVKRPRARGLGGQKAQDAATALAQAIEDMENSVPELKTVIKPVRRSVTKASLKRFNEIEDDEYNYLLDVKSEPKADCEEPKESEQDGSEADSRLETSSEHNGNSQFSSDVPNTDQQGEQIVIKAEPYDFQDDEASQSTDLYFSRKFCETNNTYENSRSPLDKLDLDADQNSDVKKELRYPCKFCGRAMQYRSHLVRHLRRVHGGEGVEEVMRRLMKCRFCDKPYSNELSLINHEKLHDGTSKMKCNKCDERFDDKNALRRHQRKTHWEHQPVECEICKKQLSDNTCLKAHMKHMHGSEEKKVTIFTCEACGRQLHTKTAFQNHVASKCGTNLLFPCDTCGKSFSFKGSLKAHQLLHTGVKSFLCKFCGKAFHQKGEMKRHERKHTGEKPFICEVCGRAFAYRESLLGHSAVHTGIKPFPCKACGMRFSCSGNLVKHRRSNNCKGFSEQSNNAVMGEGVENISLIDLVESSSVNTNVDSKEGTGAGEKINPEIRNLNQPLSMHKAGDVSLCAPQESVQGIGLLKETNVSSPVVNSVVDHSTVVKQEPMPALVPQASPQMTRPSSVVNTSHLSVSPLTSVIRSTPSINVKPASALQLPPKEAKVSQQFDVSQSYGISTNTNSRMANQFHPTYSNHETNVSVQNSYVSHNSPTTFSENQYRQTNQVGINDRRYMPFNMEGLAGRTDQYFDRQTLLRHEMSRQVMERTVDRQTSRFLDWTGGVQFSGVNVDNRAGMQPYTASSLPHTSSYPNIHSGHLGNYTAANHTTNHNMYGSNAMMTGTVGFPTFSASNHIGMGYSHNNPIPAHSAAHTGSYPASHMSHLEALFGHLSHPGNPATGSFPRLPSHNVGSPANPSYPSNHRV